MEKRTVIVNGVEFTTTVEEQITGSLIRQLCGAAKEDHVFVKSANGTPYPLADEAVLPPDADHVVIVPAFVEDCEEELSEQFRRKEYQAKMGKRNHMTSNSVPQVVPWLLVALLGLSLILSSCGLGDGISYQTPTPVATVQLSYSPQPPRTYDIWLENTAAYPRPDFHEAAHALAAAFDQAIQAGYAGALVNVSLLTANSYDPGNTIESFTIPPVPLYPQLVHHHSPDPYTDGQLAKEDEHVYQQQVQGFQQTLARVRTQVHPFLTKLSELDPPVATSGTVDMWGAWNRAAEHLQGGKSSQYLIFISSLTNDTWQEFLPLQGVWGTQTHVRVDWYFCTDAPLCQANTAFWQGAFRHGGAIESSFNDPAQSRLLALTNHLLA